jgi:hypothetical protein
MPDESRLRVSVHRRTTRSYDAVQEVAHLGEVSWTDATAWIWRTFRLSDVLRLQVGESSDWWYVSPETYPHWPRLSERFKLAYVEMRITRLE